MKKRHIFSACAAIFCTLSAFLTLWPAVRVVSFSNRKNPEEKVYSTAALNGFFISYTHSVNKGRVHDYVECIGNTFLVDKTEFVSYGAGIPEEYDSLNCEFISLPGTDSAKGTYRITGLNRKLDFILQAVGLIADHSVTINDDEFFLKEYFEPQTSLIIKIKKVSVVDNLTARRF